MESVQRRLSDLTMAVRSDTTPETATKWVTDEVAKWEAVIRGAGITVN